MAQKSYEVTGNGDGTLSMIAKLNNISLKQLRDWNNKYDDLVHIGDVYYVENPNNGVETQHLIDSEENLIERTEELEDAKVVTDSIRSRVMPIELKDNPTQGTEHCFWWLWLTIGILGGVSIWEKWLRKMVIRDKEIQYSPVMNSENSSDMEELINENQKLTKVNRQLKKKIKGLEDSNEDLLEDYIRLEKQLSESFERSSGTKKPNNDIQNTKCSTVLYADFINDGFFSHVTENPNDDSNFELHLNNENSASFVIFRPAYPRVVSNPAAFLQGCEKQVLGQTGEVEIDAEGLAQYNVDGKWKVINKLNVIIR